MSFWTKLFFWKKKKKTKPAPTPVVTGGMRAVERAITAHEIEQKALKVTGAFEGKGYDQVTDNFDGQFLSLGWAQWCLGQGSLQEKILRPYFNVNTPANFYEEILERVSKMNKKEGCSLFSKNFLTGKRFNTAGKIALESFVKKTRAFQDEALKELLGRAWGYCNQYGMNSETSFMFFFDICVQNGSIKKFTIPEKYNHLSLINQVSHSANRNTWKSLPVTEEQKKLIYLLDRRAVRNKWFQDVLNRKLTIIMKRGWVHGDYFEL